MCGWGGVVCVCGVCVCIALLQPLLPLFSKQTKNLSVFLPARRDASRAGPVVYPQKNRHPLCHHLRHHFLSVWIDACFAPHRPTGRALMSAHTANVRLWVHPPGRAEAQATVTAAIEEAEGKKCKAFQRCVRESADTWLFFVIALEIWRRVATQRSSVTSDRPFAALWANALPPMTAR